MPGDSCATACLACSRLIQKDLSLLPLEQDEFFMGPMKGSSGIGFPYLCTSHNQWREDESFTSSWFPLGEAWGQIKSNWIHFHSSGLGVTYQFSPKQIMRIRINMIAKDYVRVRLPIMPLGLSSFIISIADINCEI